LLHIVSFITPAQGGRCENLQRCGYNPSLYINVGRGIAPTNSLQAMAARLLAVAALLVGVDAASESTATSATAAMRTKLQQREREHQGSLQRLMQNMTVSSALDIVRSNSASKPELMSLIQENLMVKKSNLRSSSLQAAEKLPEGLDKARAMLNEMLAEVQVKYDLEIQKCCDYDEDQSELIEQARQDISMFNAEAAECRGRVLEASSIIELCEIKLPEFNDALETHNAECLEGITELNRLIKIILGDISIMDMILGMLDCKTTTQMFFLQRCQDSCSNTYVSFADQHHALQKAISGLKSESAKQLLADNLEEAYGSDMENMKTTGGAA
jgi:hypothetical protein